MLYRSIAIPLLCSSSAAVARSNSGEHDADVVVRRDEGALMDDGHGANELHRSGDVIVTRKGSNNSLMIGSISQCNMQYRI